MPLDPEKYRRLFLTEAHEALLALERDLVRLEQESDAHARREILDAAFRAAHSLKGMSAAVGFDAFTSVAHALEGLAESARTGHATTEVFDLLLEATDALSAMLQSFGAGAVVDEHVDLLRRLLAQPHAHVVSAEGDAVAPAAPLVSPSGGTAVRVVIEAKAPLPQVRALVCHKAMVDLPGYASTSPPVDTLKSKPLEDRTIVFFFATEAQARAAAVVAGGQGGVASAEVVLSPIAREAPLEPERLERKERVEEERTVRVKTALLDELIDSVGELLLTRSRMRALAQELLRPELFDLVDEVDRLTRDLNARVVQVRMTPLSTLSERFPRVVRDLARQLHKSVDFKMHGMSIELDRAILDELYVPLVHMLRNALDHAHEGDAVRVGRGKPAAMALALSANRDRDNVLIELLDDGGGIDIDRVKAKAVARGLISAAAAASMSEDQAVELVCLPGFSTRDAVSETSGRGVGMDVVKQTVERLGGSLKLSSRRGSQTRVVLELPLTVAIIQVLVVEVGDGGDAYTIPVGRVERALELDVAKVQRSQGRRYLPVLDRLVPLFDLAEELGHASKETGTVILVGRGDGVRALRVDRIVGQEEVVAKPLGPPLASLPYLSGAALLADGRAAFVLEPLAIGAVR